MEPVTFKRVKSMNIKDVVDDPAWQSLRASFVGTWMKQPKENVRRLRAYVGTMSCPLKVRRVLNYLTGTAFRIGMISHPTITKLRNEIRRAWALGQKNESSTQEKH